MSKCLRCGKLHMLKNDHCETCQPYKKRGPVGYATYQEAKDLIAKLEWELDVEKNFRAEWQQKFWLAESQLAELRKRKEEVSDE